MPALGVHGAESLFHGTAGSRNAQANALIREKDERIVQALIDDYQDPASTPLWRNYTVQFMGSAAAAGLGTERLHGELMRIAFDRHKPWAATALVNLYWLQKRQDLAVPEGLLPQWITWARHDLVPPHAQASLLNILIDLDPAAARELARRRVEDASDRTQQRAAVHALGLVGDDSDTVVLRALAGSSESPVGEPAQIALERLSKREAAADVAL